MITEPLKVGDRVIITNNSDKKMRGEVIDVASPQVRLDEGYVWLIKYVNNFWSSCNYKNTLVERESLGLSDLKKGEPTSITQVLADHLNAPTIFWYKLTSKRRTIMETISMTAKKLLDSNTKKLIKAGFLDNELNLTESGREALDAILIEKHKVELVTMAEEVIKEQKCTC